MNLKNLAFLNLLNFVSELNYVVFGLDVVSQSKIVNNEMYDSFKAIGIKQTNVIHNMGNLGQAMMIYFAAIPVLALIVKPFFRLRGDEKREASAYFLLIRLMWNPLLILCVISYLPMCFSSRLNFEEPMFSNFGENMGFIFSILLSILCYIWLPLTALYVARVSSNMLLTPEMHRKYSFLFESLRHESFGQRAYFLVFIIRRLFLLLLIFELGTTDGGGVQIVLLVISNILSLLYTFISNPLIQKHDRSMNLSTEVFTMVLCYQLMWLTDWVSNVELNYSLGWIYVITIALLMVSHMHVFLGSAYNRIRLYYLRWYKRYQYNQKMMRRRMQIGSGDPFQPPQQSLFNVLEPTDMEMSIFTATTLPKQA